MAAKKPMTTDDLLALRQVGDPQISPDGSAVVYLVTELDEESKEFRSHLWWVSALGGRARQLTCDDRSVAEPRWSPDGRHVAFLARRGDDEARQIWVLPMDGGEARRVTRADESARGIDWSPDGGSLLYLSREAMGEEEKRLQDQGGIRVVDRFVRMEQIWVVEVETGRCRQLTRDRSTKSAATWSPDGRSIAYEQRRQPDSNADYRASLWVMAATGRGKRRLGSGKSCDTTPRWSPDGKQIAFLRRRAPAYARLDELAVMEPRAGAPARILTARLDRGVTEHRWSSDGRRLYAIVHDGVRQHLHRVTVPGGRIRQLTDGDRSLSSLRVSGALLAFISETPTKPGEIGVVTAGTSVSDERALTSTNPQLRGRSLGRTRILRWLAPDGLEIEGLLVLPATYRKGRRLPLVVWPHGGPAGSRGCSFDAGGQVMAGRGYALLLPNFRGSSGYGQAFLTANDDDFGGGDFRDIMAGVDAVIERGIADPRRLAILGYSYGGYMTSWAIGQTERFSAAVVGAGVTNLQSFYGTTDIQWFTCGYQHGRPWENPDSYRAQSPMTYVGRVVTPTLIYHGEEDRRVPMEQSEQLYVSLRARGVPTEFVRYPREGHGLAEYWHRRDCLERALAWLDRWIGKKQRKT